MLERRFYAVRFRNSAEQKPNGNPQDGFKVMQHPISKSGCELGGLCSVWLGCLIERFHCDQPNFPVVRISIDTQIPIAAHIPFGRSEEISASCYIQGHKLSSALGNEPVKMIARCTMPKRVLTD